MTDIIIKRLDKIEKRLKSIDKKLDELLEDECCDDKCDCK